MICLLEIHYGLVGGRSGINGEEISYAMGS